MLERANPPDGDAALRPDIVMIVEDDGLLSMMLEDLVHEQGAAEVQSFRDPAAALGVAARAPIDYAILDLSLRGGPSYQVADVLAARNIPFLFCTALPRGEVAERHRQRPLLSKPYGDADFKACLAQALAR